MRVGKVVWVDSMWHGGWFADFDSIDTGEAQCVSFGFIQVKKTVVKVAGGLSLSNGDLLNIVTIPRGCVKEITYVSGKGWEYLLEGEKPRPGKRRARSSGAKGSRKVS